MLPFVRHATPYCAAAAGVAAVAWAISFGTLPRADFTFSNEDEVKTVDPGKAAGVPEERILSALYEGLLTLTPAHQSPDRQGVVPLVVVPGVAELPEVSTDGCVYTFTLRPNARWSDGSAVTAQDFVWSWRRTLHPDNASEYSYQLYYLRGAKEYNTLQVAVGDRVEVELADRRDALQPFPRGTMAYGVLRDIVRPPAPEPAANQSAEEFGRQQANWQRRWVYLVEEKSRGLDGEVTVPWDRPGPVVAFTEELPPPDWRTWTTAADAPESVVACQHVLRDFASTVGVQAVGDHVLVVTLQHPTPFFAELVTFYPLYPVNRRCVERFGSPTWTKPQHIVTNGPFILQARRLRDRLRLVKNPHYWNAAQIQLETIDALPIKSRVTSLNMYLKGELDWVHAPVGNMIPLLKNRPDYVSGPALMTYFYRLNVRRRPLDDVRVRQALNLALDKQLICRYVTQAGELPARSVVPLGMPGYERALCGDYSPLRARELLADAGFPEGRGFPKLELLLNADEMHRAIAEVAQQQWKQTLGIDIELRAIAWSAYLDAMQKSDFDICRAGWVPDYSDPNTFLDIFVSDGPQNDTNWASPRYDELIAAAAAEADVQQRMRLLHDAEQLLMEQLPVIPIYYYVTKNLVKPRVKNFFPTLQDRNPLSALGIRDATRGD